MLDSGSEKLDFLRLRLGNSGEVSKLRPGSTDFLLQGGKLG